MLDDIRFDLQTLDHRAVTPEQLAALKRRLVGRAHAERRVAMQAMAGEAPDLFARRLQALRARTFGLLVRLWHRALRHWRITMRPRGCPLAVAELHALGNRQLSDMGLRHCETSSVVAMFGRDRMRLRALR